MLLTDRGSAIGLAASNPDIDLKPMKTISILVGSLLLSLTPVLAGPINKDCPVKGRAVDGSKAVEISVGFCCGRCKAKFDKDPAALLAKVAETEDGKCPISGRDVDEDATSKIAVAVCCNGCKGKVEGDPKAYLAKLGAAGKKKKKGS